MSDTIKITSGILNPEKLTMFTEAGEEIVVMQGDPRLRPIMDCILQPITENGVAYLPKELLEVPKYEDRLPFEEFETATEKSVSFFRVAKKTLAKLFGFGKESKQEIKQKTAELQQVDTLPSQEIRKTVQRAALSGEKSDLEQKQRAVQEILAGAIPASSPNFRSEKVERQPEVKRENDSVTAETPEDIYSEASLLKTVATDTIIALVDGEIIPGVEKIESQFKFALKFGSPTGVLNLLKRMAAVQKKYGHTAEDVFRFMQRGDMQVTDSGDIVAYKALKLVSDNAYNKLKDAPARQYVDCHSKKVYQWVGSIVQMDESLVDRSRTTECSNGLHIARRGYLRNGFGNADIVTLVLIAPEDIIAVPNYDANKIRVCRYTIVHELSQAQKQLVWSSKPFTNDPEGKIILGNVIAGLHAKPTHISHISAGMGGGLSIKSLNPKIKESEKGVEIVTKDAVAPNAKLDATKEAECHPDTVVAPETPKDAPVDVMAVNSKANSTRKDQAKVLYDSWVRWSKDPLSNLQMLNDHYAKLLEYKKSTKASWDKLGIPNDGKVPTIEGKSQDQIVQELTNETKVNGPDAHQQLVDTVAGIVTSMAKTKAKIVKESKAEAATPKVADSKQIREMKQKAKKAPAKPKAAKKASTAPTPKEKKKMTVREDLDALLKKKMTPREELAILLKDKTPEQITKAVAESAQSIKQFAKKGWSVLGVNPEIEKAIKKKLDSTKW